MSYYNSLLISYIMILTFGYFVTFLLYYMFGWFYDKRLRLVMKRVQLSKAQSFFLHFRGIPHEGLNIHTAVCAYCEIFSLIALLGLEGVSLLMIKFLNFDIVVACRISLSFMLIAIIAWIIMVAAVSSEFRKRINIIKNEGRVEFKKYKDLDNIVLGMENLSAWAPENSESVPDEPNAESWQKYVVDFESLAAIGEGKKNVKVRTPSGSFYRPVVENEDIDSLEQGYNVLSSANPLDRDTFIPVSIKDGDAVEDITSGKKELSSLSPLDNDIFMPVISGDVEEFGYEEPKSSFENASGISQGKEALRDMAKKQLEAEQFPSGRTPYGSGTRTVSDKKSENGKSVKDIINEHIDEINPENKFKNY